MNAPFPEQTSHPLAAFGLDLLARGAARLRGERIAISEAGPGSTATVVTYRDLDQFVCAFAARMTECGLRQGDRILVVGVARISVVAAVLGALSAGIEPIVAPAHLQAGALAFLAQTTGAAGIFAPTLFGGLDMESLLVEAAAAAPGIRIVGSLGPGVADGAIDFSPQGLAGISAPPRVARRDNPPRIGLVLRPEQRAPRATFVTQSALVGQGLDVVSALNLAADRPTVSTLSPASLAGLIAGPIAALLAGAPLTLFGPFDAAGLALLLDRSGQACLIAPAAAGGELIESGVCANLDCLALSGEGGAWRGPSPCLIVRLESDGDGRLAISAGSA